MDGSQIGIYVGQAVTIVVALIALLGKRVRTPADDNDSVRLGNEFLRSLLQDAKSEREELRKTIEELRTDAAAHADAIGRLEALQAQKDARITALEDLLEALTDKLQRGEVITLEDILGSEAAHAAA